ncbi:AAA family ATPase [Solidesulfovibrio sp. C21]|uniref:AAA family ATPase n=1 Tax=Solidesulfovibrio sp. C21 TaxID=3398613 RepID=UPI0039FBD315
MDSTWNEIHRLVQQADQLDADGRLTIFEFLAQIFSLIPLRDRFPTQAEIEEHGSLAKAAKKYKAPTEKGWNRWCREKRPFDRTDFSTDRAGVACGPASGVLVLDVDNPHLFDAWMQEHHPDESLPVTLKVKTGGHGERFHYYFQYPSGGEQYFCRSVKGIFDIRGISGQVLCPGSLHPETRKPYIFAERAPIAPAPLWLLEMSKKSEGGKKDDDEQSHLDSISEKQVLEIAPVDSFLSNLNLSDDTKQKILTTFPQGQRSEPSWSVLLGLLNASVDEQSIRTIYQTYPIGEKARENPKWFDREIQRVKQIIAQNPIGVNMQLGFSSGANPSSSDSEYGIVNAFEVLTAQTSFEFLIDNFWPKDEPLLITGYGGAGKSVLTLQIAMDLVFPPANGFLNKFKVLHGGHRVLFVQSENSLVGMRRRLELIRGAYAIPEDVIQQKLFFLGRRNDIRASGDIDSKQFQDVIKKHHSLIGFDIIIVDPLISFHNKDENSNDEMRRLLDNFSEFCESIKVSPLIIHHHGKFKQERGVGGGRGASAIGDWSPNTWELEYKEKDKKFKFIHKKARNFMLNDDLVLELKSLRFTANLQQSSGKNDTTYYVIKALQNLNGVAQTQTVLKNEVVNVYKAENPAGSITAVTAVKYITDAVNKNAVKAIPGTRGSISYQL